MSDAANRGVGIEAWDAGFRISPGCTTSGIDPCPDPILTYFSGFEDAIYAYTWSETPSIFINGAVFDDNGFGIKLEAINYVTVINSEFNIGQSFKGLEQCSTVYGVGIYLHHCVYYTIENNTFNGGYSGNPNTQDNYIGIWVQNNHFEFFDVQDNEIYRNTFNHLTDGNLAIGKHVYAENGFWVGGLQYKCNNNSNNKYDFRTGNIGNAGIWLDQGSFERAAGNKFSKHSTPPGSDFANFAKGIAYGLWYFYWPDPYDLSQFPENVINVIPFPANNPHPCTDNYGGGTGQINLMGLTEEQKDHFEQMLSENQAIYNSIYNVLCGLIC